MYALAVAVSMFLLFLLFGRKMFKIYRELYSEVEIEQ